MPASAIRRLVLLRHAKSAWPDVPDHERPLAGRGRRDAPVLGRWLQVTGSRPDQVVCSTTQRTRQTWQLAAAELDAPPPVSYDDRVYGATAADLLDLARQAGPEVRSLMFVGHDPGLPDLALALGGAGSDMAALGRLRAKFPTAAIAVLTFAGDWPDLAPERARLIAFVTPADLRAELTGEP
jgi:phosphohistidine phosphatase